MTLLKLIRMAIGNLRQEQKLARFWNVLSNCQRMELKDKNVPAYEQTKFQYFQWQSKIPKF